MQTKPVPKWLRLLVYEIYNKQCCICGSRRLLQVHHLSYDEPITLDKLELRCLFCHVFAHPEHFNEMIIWAINKYGIDKVFS